MPSYGGGLSVHDPRLVFVQVLLYGMSMEAPTVEDARKWADHFEMDRAQNRIVLVGTKELQNQASYDMIPGFQLIDKNFILRCDSTGHSPKENLYQTLLPMIPRLLAEPPLASIESSPKMSVEEAYRAIPHHRTVFDASGARMENVERIFLEQFFSLVDSAIVQRVEMLSYLQSGGQRGQVWRKSGSLFNDLNALNVPPTLRPVYGLVSEAITEQRKYLDEWYQAFTDGKPYTYRFRDNPNHSLVTSSSQKLHQAYDGLMKLYPQESDQNKAAFFDYLCALDFI